MKSGEGAWGTSGEGGGGVAGGDWVDETALRAAMTRAYDTFALLHGSIQAVIDAPVCSSVDDGVGDGSQSGREVLRRLAAARKKLRKARREMDDMDEVGASQLTWTGASIAHCCVSYFTVALFSRGIKPHRGSVIQGTEPCVALTWTCGFESRCCFQVECISYCFARRGP